MSHRGCHEIRDKLYIVRVSFMSFDLECGHARNSVVLLYSRACAQSCCIAIVTVHRERGKVIGVGVFLYIRLITRVKVEYGQLFHE